MPVQLQGATAARVNLTAYRIALPTTTRSAVNAAANAAKQEYVRELHAAAPAGRLRGSGKAGARLSVRYDLKGSGEDNVDAVVRAVGPWQLIENRTKPHLIVSKKLGSRKRRAGLETGLFVRAPGRRLPGSSGGSQGAILTPQGPRAYARHPGTAGKHPWAKGEVRALPAASVAYLRSMQAGLERQFR